MQIAHLPAIPREEWAFTVVSDGGEELTWDWLALCAQPLESFLADLHCVLGWSAVDVPWEGVPMRSFLDGVVSRAPYAEVCAYDGYVTTLPTEDLTEMPTWLAVRCNGKPLTPEHGAPARLLVPHLYGWKSVKWVRRLTLTAYNQPGTRERAGYHAYGDPWRQQRARLHPSSDLHGQPELSA